MRAADLFYLYDEAVSHERGAAFTTVTDFQDGIDKIAVVSNGHDTLEERYAFLRSHAVDSAEGLLISTADDISHTLQGITLAQFDIGDIVLV